MMQMETPKSAGSSAGPRRLNLSSTSAHFRRLGISSPIATSSPMVFSSSFNANLCTPTNINQQVQRSPFHQYPSPMPKHCPSSSGMPQQHHHLPASRTNTIRSTRTDFSSVYTMQEPTFDERHAQLLQTIQMQRELVEQAVAAITYCRKKYSFSGTLQELSAQRLLLVTQERLLLLHRQMDQLKDQQISANFALVQHQQQLQDIPESVDLETDDVVERAESVVSASMSRRGALYIDKLVLHLNPSFSMKKVDKEASYAFIVLCRHVDTIYATQVANVLDVGELRNNKVKIKELIVFEDLHPEFCVLIEVFAMKIGKRWEHKWQYVWDFAARAFRNLRHAFTGGNGNGASHSQSAHHLQNHHPQVDLNNNNTGGGRFAATSASSMLSSSSARPSASAAGGNLLEFRRCGYLHLNRESLALDGGSVTPMAAAMGIGIEKEDHRFLLNDAEYPLEGSVQVFARFALHDSSMQPPMPRPNSAEVDLPRLNQY